jgi:hypothetical protein
MSQHTEELEAALAEGLAPMPAHLLAYREEKLELDRQIDLLKERKEEIKKLFNQYLATEGLKGYIVDGKPKVTRTPLSLSRFDGKTFVKENPVLAARYTVVKKESERTFRIDIRP